MTTALQVANTPRLLLDAKHVHLWIDDNEYKKVSAVLLSNE